MILEKRFGDHFTLVTQNVDGLHQTAGSVRVLDVRAFNAVVDEALRDIPPSSAAPYGAS